MRVPLNRRDFASAALAAWSTRSVVRRLFEPELHERIAANARALVGNRSVTLRLLHPQGCAANLLPIVKDFTKRTTIRVELDDVGVDDINRRMLLETLSGRQTFDVALPATFGIADLAESNCLTPLDALAAEYEPEGFGASFLYRHGDRHRGRLYGYQTDGDAYLMFYNRRLLENEKARNRFEKRHGRELRTAETWEELDVLMQFFKDELNAPSVLFRTPTYLAWEFWLRLHAKGRLPFDRDMEPQLDSREAHDALEALCRATDHQYTHSRSNGLFANWKAFATGEFFSNIGWGGTQKHIHGPDSRIRDHIVVAPTPGGKLGGKTVPISYFNWGWSFTVGKQSRHRDLAFHLAIFATSPVPSTNAVQARGFFDPFREEHYSDATIRRQYSEGFLRVHREALAKSIPDLYVSGAGRYWKALRRFVDLAVGKSLEPTQALEAVHESWRKLRAADRKDTPEQWKNVLASYPPDLREQLS